MGTWRKPPACETWLASWMLASLYLEKEKRQAIMSWFNEIAEACLAWLWHSGWQAAVVALAVLAILKMGQRKLSSQLKYVLLLIVLVKFATPPFLNLPTGLFSQPWFDNVSSVAAYDGWDGQTAIEAISPAAVPGSANDAIAAVSQPTVVHASTSQVQTVERRSLMAEPRSLKHSRWAFAKLAGPLSMFSVYLAGVMFCIVRLGHRYWRVRQLVSRASIVDAGPVYDQLTAASQKLSMRRKPELRLSADSNAPFALGAFRPVIVLPEKMVAQLESEKQQIVIAHELVHVRRLDLVVGWAEVLLSTLWWFHPAMWWLKRSLRRTREDCCDDVLIASQLAQPERYCETLIEAAANSTGPSLELLEPLVLGFSNREHPAGRRIRRLMDDSIFRSDRIRISAIVVALLLALVALPGMRQAETNQAQEPAELEEPKTGPSKKPVVQATETITPKRITGQVVNEQGQPIVGAKVQARLSSISKSNRSQWTTLAQTELETGGDGSFTLNIDQQAPKDHELNFHAFIESENCFQKRFYRHGDFFVDENIQLKPIKLTRGIRIKGRVVSPASATEQPENAYVTVLAEYLVDEHSDSPYEQVTCDDMGRFDYVVPANCELSLDARATNFGSSSVEHKIEPVNVTGNTEIEECELGNIELKQGVSVFGTAKRRDGLPAAGVVIGIVEGDVTNPSDVSSSKTDAQGHFRLPPHIGKCTLLSLKECRTRKIVGAFQGGLKSDAGFPLFDSVEVNLDGSKGPELEVQLVEAETIVYAGVVQNEEGHPVSGITVLVGWYGDSGLLEVGYQQTNENGKYLSRVPKGRVPWISIHDQRRNQEWFQPFLARSTLNVHADLFENPGIKVCDDLKFKPATANVSDLDWVMTLHRSQRPALRRIKDFARWWFLGE